MGAPRESLCQFVSNHKLEVVFTGFFHCAQVRYRSEDSELIQVAFKQAPFEAAGSCQKRKSSNLIQRFINHLTVAGVDLHCPLHPRMNYYCPKSPCYQQMSQSYPQTRRLGERLFRLLPDGPVAPLRCVSDMET